MAIKTLDELAQECGFFVGDCEYPCNNGYGCSNTKNTDIDPESCPNHGRCVSYSCPEGNEIEPNDGRGGGEILMEVI